MQSYLDQLCADIEAITADRQVVRQSEADSSFENHIQEVERYLHERPMQTLAQHTGLEKVRFPPAEKLTETQCAALAEALAKCYFAFGVGLDIPRELPSPIQYQHYVAALDERVFTSYFGMTTIERCHYDYDGYCPFMEPNCPCHQRWEEEVAKIQLRPGTQWNQHDRLEVCWHELRQELLTCNAKLLLDNQVPTAVTDLVLRLQIAWERRHERDVWIAYCPDPEEIPAGPRRNLFAWLEVEDIILPEKSQLSPTETRIITAYLLQLLGKELIILEVAAWPLNHRYAALRQHFSCLLGRATTPEGMKLVCLPGQENIYENIRQTGQLED
jgi:hypothetical protein